MWVWGERRQMYVKRNGSLIFSLLLCVRKLHIKYVIAVKTKAFKQPANSFELDTFPI